MATIASSFDAAEYAAVLMADLRRNWRQSIPERPSGMEGGAQAAEKAVAEANATIAAVCRELGIPKTFVSATRERLQ
jgi:hypothetical protein